MSNNRDKSNTRTFLVGVLMALSTILVVMVSTGLVVVGKTDADTKGK